MRDRERGEKREREGNRESARERSFAKSLFDRFFHQQKTSKLPSKINQNYFYVRHSIKFTLFLFDCTIFWSVKLFLFFLFILANAKKVIFVFRFFLLCLSICSLLIACRRFSSFQWPWTFLSVLPSRFADILSQACFLKTDHNWRIKPFWFQAPKICRI